MKFLIVIACALAAASAGHVVPVTHYPGAQHFPVINHEGVPVDTAEVQHAQATHHAHKVNVAARNGDHIVAPVVGHAPVAPVAPVVHHPVHPAHPIHHVVADHAYPTTAVAPASIHGVPLETPEVVAAKINHFAAHSEALARNGYPAAVVYRHRRGVYAPLPVAYHAAYTYAAHTPYGFAHHY